MNILQLRNLRRYYGLSQKALGERLNCSESWVKRAETGRRRVSAAELERIALALGVPPELLGEDDRVDA